MLLHGKVNVECGSLIQLTFGSNDTAMVVNDLLADSKPDSCAAIFTSSVKALKDFKDSVPVFWFKANTVVGD